MCGQYVKEFYTLADLKNWDAKSKSPVRLGVLGDPVAQSLSPQMQNAALESAGLKERYAQFQIGAEELREGLEFIRRLSRPFRRVRQQARRGNKRRCSQRAAMDKLILLFTRLQ